MQIIQHANNAKKWNTIMSKLHGEQMPNLMKHTECRICKQNLENLTYDKMMAHVQRHADDKAADEDEARNQTGLDDF